MVLQLVNFIRSCFENLCPIDKLDTNIVKESAQLYQSALRQSGENIVHRMLKKNTQIRSNFFAWMNYLLLTLLCWETLEESLSGFYKKFHEATESIQDLYGRLLMHIE